MKIVWSPLALERASEIVDYIAQDKPSAAINWINIVFSKVELLALSPEMGRVVPEIGSIQFRELIYGNYRIIYRFYKKQIFVLTIRHGMQILPIDEILS
jgi:toxin ParE1/3/4